MNAIRIMVVEDDSATRDRLAAMISEQPDMSLTGTAACLSQAESLLGSTEHDVCITDLGLPDGSGIDLIRTARRDYPGIEIMVISLFGDERNVMSAIEAGATGYLLKGGSAAEITDSIRHLIGGGSPISPSIARQVLNRFARPASPSAPRAKPADAAPNRPLLTPKEIQVLQQIAKGYSYCETAASLDISVHTITSHIKNLYRKLAVRSRGEAVFEAVQLGLIRVESRIDSQVTH